MDFEASILIIISVIIAVMALGLAGCVRALMLLAKQVEERLGVPRRLEVGDRIGLPPQIASAGGPSGSAVLLFLSPGCKACVAAGETLSSIADEAGDSSIRLIEVWAGQRDTRLESPHRNVTVLQQGTEVFNQFHVGVTPFAAIVEDTLVTMRGVIGTIDSRRKLASQARQAFISSDQESPTEDPAIS